MTAHDQFLQTIIANPDDDAPRLVFADWLEEQGECERAEFIRVQVELALLLEGIPEFQWDSLDHVCDPDSSDDQEWKHHVNVLRHREYGLRGCEFFPSWCPLIILHNVNTSRYVRGFIESIDVPWSQWLAYHEQIRTATPLRKCRLTDRPEIEFRFSPIEDCIYCEIAGVRVVIEESRPGSHAHERMLEQALEKRWPGIEFELPAAPESPPIMMNTLIDRMSDGEIANLGIQRVRR